MNRSTRIVLFTCLAVVGAACGGGDQAPDRTVRGVSTARKEADEIFQSRCVTCHGNSGHGDGPGAAACNPKPRTFADGAWQKTVTDEQIIRTVTLGGAAVGKSPQMPAQPDLKGKTEMLQQLAAIVRSFAQQ